MNKTVASADTAPNAFGAVRDWLLKGTLGGVMGVLVTLGVQQTEALRERQRIARVVLVEVERNAATRAAFLSGNATNLTEERSRYEATLGDQGVLPLDVVQLLYRTYSASAEALSHRRWLQDLLTSKGRIEDDAAAPFSDVDTTKLGRKDRAPEASSRSLKSEQRTATTAPTSQNEARLDIAKKLRRCRH